MSRAVLPVRSALLAAPNPRRSHLAAQKGARMMVAETRKLAAILVYDVVGYSRLTGTDEDRILAQLRALRSDLIDPIIALLTSLLVTMVQKPAV
jgi:class 3 adenylate cyclase